MNAVGLLFLIGIHHGIYASCVNKQKLMQFHKYFGPIVRRLAYYSPYPVVPQLTMAIRK